MTLTTTATLDGHRIETYLGVVTGEAIMGANIMRDLFAAVTDIVGGRSSAYEQKLDEARRMAFAEMTQRATALGANAVVGIDLDYEVVGNSGSMLMVAVSGTAVKATPAA